MLYTVHQQIKCWHGFVLSVSIKTIIMETAAIVMLIAGGLLLVFQTLIFKDKNRKQVG